MNSPKYLHNMPESELLAKIEKLQEIQKTHRSTSSAWIQAGELLEPLFAEMARRQKMPKPEAVAEAFVAILREWLSEEEFETVRETNRDEGTDTGACASHAFCDANMAMDEALRKLGLGDALDAYLDDEDKEKPEHEAFLNLWNAAWDIAKRDHLTAAKGEK